MQLFWKYPKIYNNQLNQLSKTEKPRAAALGFSVSDYLLNLITADFSLQNKTTYCQNYVIVPNNSLLFRFESSSKTWLKGSIGVDLRRYIWITINDILTNSFYIGEERANEIFEYYN